MATFIQGTGKVYAPTPSSPINVNVVSGDNEVKIEGKNLLDLSLFNDTEFYSITDNNVISLKNDNRGWNSLPYITLDAGTYTFVSDNTIKRVQVGDIDTRQAIATATSDNYLQFTLTATTKIGFKLFGLGGDTYPITYVKPMLLKGAYSTYPTSYTPYTSQNYPISLGTIELCKIGDYQDYIYKDNGNWYLHKEIGKLQLNISDMNNAENYPGWKNIDLIKNSYPQEGIPLGRDYGYRCNIKEQTNWAIYVDNRNNDGVVYLNKDTFNLTQTQWKTDYPNLQVILYLCLATSTNTQINDTNLINQLEALKGAMSYEGQTNISSGFMIVGASALGELE